MDDSERIERLLDQYEDALDAGQPLELEHLCRECPHLLAQVRDKIALLARVDELMASDDGDHAGEIPAETVAGRYRAISHLGQGGLGQVFVAIDEELEREVALKRILPGRAADADNRARFRREARITGRLEHPGIVPVYGLGADSKGQPYYAMRRVAGDTFDAAIERHHRKELGLPALLRNFLAICQTIAFAHSRGIIHRDLKPQNVLVGDYGETLVIDWGLAKPLLEVETDDPGTAEAPTAEGVTPTMHGARKGSPAYMSPEQAQGLPAAEAADIYALGATLYKILTGRAPFGESAEIWERILTGDCPPPGALNREVPTALDAVCRKAMAVHREDRYASALALAADIEHWLADEPVSAGKDPFAIRARRWVRRHRTLVFSAASMIAAGIVALTLLLIQQERANRNLTKSNGDLNRANERVENALIETGRERDRAQSNLREARRNSYLMVNLAAVSLSENKYIRAVDLLRRSSPKPGETDDFRSAEWYYLARNFAAMRPEVQGPPNPAGVAVSGDGRWVASTRGFSVSVYSVATGELAFSQPVIPFSTLVAFSPDSTLLALPAGKGVDLRRLVGVRWERGPEIDSFEHGCEGFAFSPLGNLLAASGDGGRLRLFNPHSGEKRADFRDLQGDKPLTDDKLDRLAFSADGSRLVGIKLLEPIVFEIDRRQDAVTVKLSFRGGKNQRAWAAWFEGKENNLAVEQSGEIVLFDRFRNEVRRVRLPEGGHFMASLNGDERPGYLVQSQGVAWKMRTPIWRDPGLIGDVVRYGEPVRLPLPFEQPATAVGIAPNGKSAAFGLVDGRIIIVDPDSTEPEAVFRHSGRADITGVQLSADGRRLLSTDSRKSVLFGPLSDEPSFRHEIKKDHGLLSTPPPMTVALSADGTKFAFRDGDSIAIVDAATGQPVRTIQIEAGGGFLDIPVLLAFAPDGSRLAWAIRHVNLNTNTSTGIYIGNVADDRAVTHIEIPGNVSALSYSPDGKQLALACDYGVQVRSVDDLKLVRRFPGKAFVALAFSPDSSHISVGTSWGEIRVWSLTGGDEAEVTAPLHGSAITGLAYFPNGRLVASSSADGVIRLFETVDRIERGTLACGMPIHSLALAADGKTMVAGGERGTCLVFRPTDDAAIVGMLGERAKRFPDDDATRRELAIAAWGLYLKRRRAGEENGASDALKIGRQACERFKSPDSEEWLRAFRLATENSRK